MPILLIISTIIIIFKKKYRTLVLTSLAILIYFSLVVIMFSKSQSSVMRMRVPVEIILFMCTLYPSMDLFKITTLKNPRNKNNLFSHYTSKDYEE